MRSLWLSHHSSSISTTSMITADRYFGLMSHKENPSLDVMANAEELLKRVNALLDFLIPTNISAVLVPVINSGWRPPQHNAKVGGAPNSKHIFGQAIDLADPMEELDNHISTFDLDGGVRNTLLEKFELWREKPIATKGWVHLQCVAPRSGNRTFIP